MSILFRKKGWLTVAQLAHAWTAEITGAKQDPQQFEQDLVHLLLEDIVNKRLEIQFAAEAEWPSSNRDNEAVRRLFQLPVDRPLTVPTK